ncbi:hypothetical protein Q7P37_006232 [Cladosporium fusiforme]
MDTPHLLTLPAELLAEILSHLPPISLHALNLTSKPCRELAAPLIWRDVELVDCRARTEPDSGLRTVSRGPATAPHSGTGIPAGASLKGWDEHDDLPMLRKLWVLACNPKLAASVETLTHRCHLAPPAMFTELPRTPFSGQTLSIDPRTIRLVYMAVKEALLRSFFDKHRDRDAPLRKLWLENVRIVEGTQMHMHHHKYELPLELDFTGLESIRMRRLPLPTTELSPNEMISVRSFFNYSRGGTSNEMQNGLGGNYLTTTRTVGGEAIPGHEMLDLLWQNKGEEIPHDESPFKNLFDDAYRFDDDIYRALAEDVELPPEVEKVSIESHYHRSLLTFQGFWRPDCDHWEYPPECARMFRQLFRTGMPTAAECSLAMFRSAASSLTSLNLDWALTNASASLHNDGFYERWISCVFTGNAFEQRWVPGIQGRPHVEVGLKPLEFIEAHPKLQCLAWPMSQFFSPTPSADITPRVQNVISGLGRTLVDLRVDDAYDGGREDLGWRTHVGSVCIEDSHSRRRFISEFAAEMQVLRSIKIEGGIPLDERREAIRALGRCPLERLTFIGINSVIGNTWGPQGRDLAEAHLTDGVDSLDGEDEDAITRLGFSPLVPPKVGEPFRAAYEWQGNTIRELKFCGYKYVWPPVVSTLLCKGFPDSGTASISIKRHLESMTISVWLSTVFEEDHRDEQIISYWLNTREPSTTALVSLSGIPPEPGSWAYELENKFAPQKLAERVVSFFGPFLSERAKRRKEGVRVRASFCVGDWGGIFDIDVVVGKGVAGDDVCLGWKGPREELEEGRRVEKLETRLWF